MKTKRLFFSLYKVILVGQALFGSLSLAAQNPFEESSFEESSTSSPRQSYKPHFFSLPSKEGTQQAAKAATSFTLTDLEQSKEKENPSRQLLTNIPPAKESALIAEAIEPENTPITEAPIEGEDELAAGGANGEGTSGGSLSNKTILINFNNVSIIEYIRFISKISNKNFVFDENDLQFNVTILSEEPTSIENVLSALVQELSIHGLDLMEQGGNFIIYRNPSVSSVAHVVAEELPGSDPGQSLIITQVFRLNTVDATKVAAIIRPMISAKAVIGVLPETNHLILTDLVTNIKQVSELLRSLDSPNSGLVVGQYVVKNGFLDALVNLATQIMEPIAQDQKIALVPHPVVNSIFVVSTPFLVERTISVLQHLDQNQGATKIFDLHDLQISKPNDTEVTGWSKDEKGNWVFRAKGGAFNKKPEAGQVQTPPEGQWVVDDQGRWTFVPKGATATPSGNWNRTNNGAWRFTAPGILNLPTGSSPAGSTPGSTPGTTPTPPAGAWRQTPQGTPYFLPGAPTEGLQIPGQWIHGDQGKWEFELEHGFAPAGQIGAGATKSLFLEHGGEPSGNWIFDRNGGAWVFKMKEGRPEAYEITRESRYGETLSRGNEEKTQFYIYKLLYRKGDLVQAALQSMAQSLQAGSSTIGKLITTITSVQYLAETNSLIFSGTRENLDKVIELADQLDIPLKQVFVEMLILDTTLRDSLNYGVNWGSRFGGGSWSGAEAFTSGGFPLISALKTATTTTVPDASPLIESGGFNLGIIGRHLTHNGTQFNSIGALVNAVHDNTKTNVVMNPKIIVEDNASATIFVGENTSFKTQSVANDLGSIITNNFEFRDVGTTLTVTPHISANGMITLEIDQEISAVANNNTTTGNVISNQIVGPTTNVNRTSTKVHVPDGFFIVISGMISDENIRGRSQVPCLGGLPFLGAAFSNKNLKDNKRNLLIFIRPKIVDTEHELDDMTKHQQDIFRDKSKMKELWQYEVDEAFDYLNLRSTDPDEEDDCCCNFDELLR